MNQAYFLKKNMSLLNRVSLLGVTYEEVMPVHLV
jgi:hypothetical protein